MVTMSDTTLALLGVSSGVFNVLGLIPYIRDIFLGKTKPERAMWWIYAVLFAVLFVAQANAGVRWPLVFTAASLLSAGFIALLSVRYGYGKLHRRDVISLVIAGIGIVLWRLYNVPLVAIITIIAVDFAGFWLTLVKTWHAPHSETLIAWQCSFIASLCSVLSVGNLQPAAIAYPLYSVLGTAAIVWLIVHRRAKVAVDPVDF